jgi:glyoxylase-like metal-dependent hydrolase (beta-lactamase superfamily II)
LKKKGFFRNHLKATGTHVHYGHCGGHKYFKDFYLHHEDAQGLQAGNSCKTLPFISSSEVKIAPEFDWKASDYTVEARQDFSQVENGYLFNEDLEVIHLPGHTPGSIGILDHKNKLLCTGDMLFSSAPMLDYLPGQGSRQDFKKSMEKII